jgi:hypothetical protein
MRTRKQPLIDKAETVIAGVKFTVTVILRQKGKWNCFESRYYINGRQVRIAVYQGEYKAAQQREQVA